MDDRAIRGYAILGKGDTPEMVNSEEFMIPSQSNNGRYKVLHKQEWVCDCPDFVSRGKPCKHIHATKFWLSLREKAHNDGKFEFEKDLVQNGNCPYCKSVRIVRNGTRRNKHSGVKQRYLCRDCKKRFVTDP